jgi:hypothetical protein
VRRVSGTHSAEQLLTAAEIDGLAGAQLWLTERGLRWSWATSVTRGEGGKRLRVSFTAPIH